MEKKVAKKAAATKVAAKPKNITLEVSSAAAAAAPAKKRAPRAVKAEVGTVKKTVRKTAKKATLDVTAEIAVAEPQVELSPAFKALAEPVLPPLKRENRARLMMQTPTQLFFYWSVKENPYHLLRKAFGDDTGSYTLVLKLTNLRRYTEEIHPAEAEGTWWFDVEPNGEYEAEIGFYAPNRPYFRVIYSNRIETPRSSPSPHAATEAVWNMSANKFAAVLDVAGFTEDAFEVAMAGDDPAAAETVTHSAFSRFIGENSFDLSGIAAEDIRYALLAIASGLRIEDLRSRISPALFAVLQSNLENIDPGKAMSALTEHFDIDESEFTEHEYGSAVYGASLVNFPRTLTTRRVAPLSSHSYR